MKTEKFDDEIRRKIDSINPIYRAEDVEKVASYIHSSQTSRRNYINIAFITLSTVAILGLLFWNIKQLNEKDNLLKSISELNQDLKVAKSANTPIKTDTIYITQKIEHNIPKSYHEHNGINSLRNSNLLSQNEPHPINSTLSSLNTHKKKSKDAIEENIDIQTKNNNENPVYLKENTQAVQRKFISTSFENSLVKTESKNVKDLKVDSTAHLIKTDSTAIANIELEKNIISDTSTITPFSSSNKSKNLFFQDWHYQSGLEFNMANNQIGIGVSGDILLNSKWSLSIGARMQNISNEKYHDANEFQQKKSQNFRDVYAPTIPDTTFISNIEMQYYVLQIPIFISYHLPLKNNFEMLFKVGTDIDIYARQHIDYEYSSDFAAPGKKQYDANFPTVTINNMIFSVGIDKQIGNFIFELSPYVSPQISHVAYKKEDVYYGFSLRTLYRFGN